jgi:hypothetical protein
MSEQNWIITLKKPGYLEETQILAPQKALPQVLALLLATYPEYTVQDSICIQPTDMTYHV